MQRNIPKNIRQIGYANENDKVYIASRNCTIWLQWYKDISYLKVKELKFDSSPYRE